MGEWEGKWCLRYDFSGALYDLLICWSKPVKFD